MAELRFVGRSVVDGELISTPIDTETAAELLEMQTPTPSHAPLAVALDEDHAEDDDDGERAA